MLSILSVTAIRKLYFYCSLDKSILISPNFKEFSKYTDISCTVIMLLLLFSDICSRQQLQVAIKLSTCSPLSPHSV